LLVLLDANVFVSAAITPNGIARSVVQAGIEGRFDYVVCPTLLDEVSHVLARPNISRLLPSGAAQRFVADVRGRARHEDDPPISVYASRDPGDDYLVALAVAVGVDAIVTGDADLLDLLDPPVPVTGLRAFFELLESAATD
jgi:putative PIN family toxin of toxin-antitoxin system